MNTNEPIATRTQSTSLLPVQRTAKSFRSSTLHIGLTRRSWTSSLQR